MEALPPDPYSALGLAKDATAGAIKSQYRKLVLKCHPDKIQDESLKQDAADCFHKIQSAYEIVGDEDRRSRYDAQIKLAELRKEAMERGGGGSVRGGMDVRTAAYKMPTESRGGDFYARGPDRYGRVSPQYEERRPSYAAPTEDYFEIPRASSRKHDDYERSSKRPSPKEDRPRAKTSSRDTKEAERSSRKEKTRRTEKDVRRDRERKATNATVEDDDSEYDSAERRRRWRTEEDRMPREMDAARDYFDLSRKQREEAENGAYTDPRVQKMFSQEATATERIRLDRERPRKSEESRRPSPHRFSSSRDTLNVLRRGEGKPPVMEKRRGSDRPTLSTRDTYKSSRARDREAEYTEEIREPRRSEVREKRPPTLQATKSAPPENIRPSFERQRSYSVDEGHTEAPPPQMKRSETMPTSPPAVTARESRGRREGSKLRPEDNYATPVRTPEPEVRSAKYRYGDAYADDNEVPTVNGYKVNDYQTEMREPSNGRRITKSPSPIRETTRGASPVKERTRGERTRAASSKYAAAPQPPPLPRSQSTQYAFGSKGESYVRPPMARESSGRFDTESPLYGEVRTTRGSPKPSYNSYAPPPDSVKYRPQVRPENVRVQSGYTTREKPSYSREGSGRQSVYV